ncbi:MAG: 1-acyl-sn-glycerol-3-phosphate acyltransferase [Myxococcales bacterium]|nr:1-acyl-sn-glycerol-3-phosphate acyltransferase [Myxococcales bacterium]
MRTVVYGLWTYLEFAVLAAVFVPIMALYWLLRRKDLRGRGSWMRRFGRTCVRASPIWRFRVEGQAPQDIARVAYVVVANHESSADPFLLSWLPFDMRWVAKVSLFKIPVIGWLLRLGGDIRLLRGNGDSVRAMLAEAQGTLETGLPVMIFPEGTRSPDGALQRFKDGAFQLAIDAGVPVLPLAIEGTRACRPKGSLWFGRAHAVVRVLPPISTAGMTRAEVPRLREATRASIRDALVEMRQRPVEMVPEPELSVAISELVADMASALEAVQPAAAGQSSGS